MRLPGRSTHVEHFWLITCTRPSRYGSVVSSARIAWSSLRVWVVAPHVCAGPCSAHRPERTAPGGVARYMARSVDADVFGTEPVPAVAVFEVFAASKLLAPGPVVDGDARTRAEVVE